MSGGRSAARLAVAGVAGDSGKTIVTLAVALAARERTYPVCGFKKGPDYIDGAWLEWATGRPARNLDTYLMGFDGAVASFARNSAPGALALIEGNRGLFDGVDARGTHSTAELAKALAAPVLLVLNAAKVTRTAAACVLGCQRLDPELRLAGVVLNNVCGVRHARVLREAIEDVCGLPVLGSIPRLETELVPARHLGLVTPAESGSRERLADRLRTLVAPRLDMDRILEAAAAPPLPHGPELAVRADGNGLRIGYVKDSAFTFYYPENLESLERAGAQLVRCSALENRLPDGLDALYIGGGFPETHAAALAENREFLASLRRAAEAGLPVYAECGGLMLLSRAIVSDRRYPMAGVLPFEVEMCRTPQGHGYTELLVDRANPFFAPGTRLRGHEFHYSRIAGKAAPRTACVVLRGAGCHPGRDAALAFRVWASYTHLHALATPEWAGGLLAAARSYADGRNRPSDLEAEPQPELCAPAHS